MTLMGLPHSEISGSKRACRSPKHIAACHVLHRLSVPRHPPSTLSNLTIKCLDLMRSAASDILRHRCASHLQPIFNCQGTLRSHGTNAELDLRSRDRAHRSSRGRSLSLSRCCGNSLNRWRMGQISVGGADRDRTDDPLLAKQVLSQLSYSPGMVAASRQIENWRTEN